MTESVGPHTVRASDAEREEFARIIREAVGEGRLLLDEGEDRLAKIYAARYREELPPLIRDLPPSDSEDDARGPQRSKGYRGESRWHPADDDRDDWGARGRGPRGGPWRGGPWRAGPGPWGSHGPPGLGGRGALWRHAAFTVVLAGALIGIWAITASHFFWPAIPLVFLTLGLARHARWHAWSARR